MVNSHNFPCLASLSSSSFPCSSFPHFSAPNEPNVPINPVAMHFVSVFGPLSCPLRCDCEGPLVKSSSHGPSSVPPGHICFAACANRCNFKQTRRISSGTELAWDSTDRKEKLFQFWALRRIPDSSVLLIAQGICFGSQEGRNVYFLKKFGCSWPLSTQGRRRSSAFVFCVFISFSCLPG